MSLLRYFLSFFPSIKPPPAPEPPAVTKPEPLPAVEAVKFTEGKAVPTGVADETPAPVSDGHSDLNYSGWKTTPKRVTDGKLP